MDVLVYHTLLFLSHDLVIMNFQCVTLISRLLVPYFHAIDFYSIHLCLRFGEYCYVKECVVPSQA